ncbi:hypothetical protein NQ317_000562 [Molorchus minor]|uniref:Uncharacterized protein n=1 Tax=Molorchus minor TaxID=1323400 RepID=A0ABQ9IZI6_9CUCU|nr:hypothetical protein NQ317_000562 [Molorchus minor]
MAERTLILTQTKVLVEKKIQDLVKSLFTRDSKKKKEKQADMVREESLRARYVEYKGKDTTDNRYQKNGINELRRGILEPVARPLTIWLWKASRGETNRPGAELEPTQPSYGHFRRLSESKAYTKVTVEKQLLPGLMPLQA